MHHYPPVIQQLIQRIAQLPTIGPKTAERIVFALLKKDANIIRKIGTELVDLSQRVIQCTQCYNFSETNPCTICADTNRDKSLLCVIADPQDLAAIERTNQYAGYYFVLGGTISTYYGTGPKEIRIPDLLEYITAHTEIAEIILAIDQTADGETTTMYLSEHLQKTNRVISRLARGLPVGADVEYADEVTLSAALENRRRI